MPDHSAQPLRDRTFASIAEAYFARRGPRLKGLANMLRAASEAAAGILLDGEE